MLLFVFKDKVGEGNVTGITTGVGTGIKAVIGVMKDPL